MGVGVGTSSSTEEKRVSAAHALKEKRVNAEHALKAKRVSDAHEREGASLTQSGRACWVTGSEETTQWLGEW